MSTLWTGTLWEFHIIIIIIIIIIIKWEGAKGVWKVAFFWVWI